VTEADQRRAQSASFDAPWWCPARCRPRTPAEPASKTAVIRIEAVTAIPLRPTRFISSSVLIMIITGREGRHSRLALGVTTTGMR
jgi:hypothetical protein